MERLHGPLSPLLGGERVLLEPEAGTYFSRNEVLWLLMEPAELGLAEIQPPEA